MVAFVLADVDFRLAITTIAVTRWHWYANDAHIFSLLVAEISARSFSKYLIITACIKRILICIIQTAVTYNNYIELYSRVDYCELDLYNANAALLLAALPRADMSYSCIAPTVPYTPRT
jgi:hypothetical protein